MTTANAGRTILWALLMLASPSCAFAQGADTGSGLAQSRRGSTDDTSQSGKKGPVVHVGAGTTNASTTGFSGETKQDGAPSGKLDVPSLPSADLCDSYKDSSSYQGCLRVVLRNKGGAQ